MSEDRKGSGQHFQDLSNPNYAPLISVTRREVLAGISATSVLVATYASAEDLDLDVNYGDETRRELVVTLVARITRTAIAKWRLAAELFADVTAGDKSRFERRRTPDTIEAWISNARFPGGRPFRLAFLFARRAGVWYLQLNLDGVLPEKDSNGLATPNRDFVLGELESDPVKRALRVEDVLSGSKTLQIQLRSVEVSQLLMEAFGDRVQFIARSANAGAVLTLQCALISKVECGLGPGGETQSSPLFWRLAAESGGEFVLLAGHVRFNTLRFGVLTDAVVKAGVFRIGEAIGSSRSEDVRDLYSDPDDPLAAQPLQSHVLYGLAEDPAKLVVPHDVPPNAPVAFAIGTLTSASAESDVSVAAELRDATIDAVGFRNPGPAVLTTSVIRGAFSLFVTRSPRNAENAPTSKQLTEEGPFVISRGTVRRGKLVSAGGYAPGTWTIARLEPTSKEHLVQTQHGPLEVAGHAPIAAKPGRPPRTPPIIVASVQTDAGRRLHQFEAPLSLTYAGAKVGNGGDNLSDRDVVSRLDFSDTSCLFYLPALGPDALGADAEASVALGVMQSQKTIPQTAGAFVAAPMRLSLDGAKLRVDRPADLLHLTYRFVGLVLEVNGPDARIVPDRRMAACGATLPRIGLSQVDTRPIMVVEFPPQHVAERAYLRQIDEGADPPDVALIAKDDADGRELAEIGRLARQGTLTERIVARKKLRDRKIGEEKVKATAESIFDRFQSKFQVAAEGLPEDQRIYAGREFLDPDPTRPDPQARRLARRVMGDLLKESNDPISQLYRLPDVSLNPQEVDRISSEVKQAKGKNAKKEDIDGQIELAKQDRDDDYRVFSHRFNEYFAPSYQGRAEYIARNPSKEQAAAVLKVLSEFDAEVDKKEEFDQVTEARLSGPSRLAFRINCDDYDGGRPDASFAAMPPGGFPFTIAALTNWGAFDLSVVRRAEKLFEPPVGQHRIAPRWARQEVLDQADILHHQLWFDRDTSRVEMPDPSAESRATRIKEIPGRLTGDQRMAQIYASAKDPPLWTETAIELPFRLHLSPAQDALWRTPLPAPTHGLYSAGTTSAADQPVPLWFASLDDDIAAPTVRAVWSPDFRPDAFRDRSLNGAPFRGPWAPWSIPPDFSDRNRPANEVEVKKLQDKSLFMPFRASLDAHDRHELVGLTSLHGLPTRGRRRGGGQLADGSQFNPPDGYKIRDAILEKLGSSESPDDYSAIYRPQPLRVPELTLTSLGGTIDLDTSFIPPASVRVQRGSLQSNLFDAFTIERWRHRTVLGRDILVEVVYKGFLFPFGHRASLVKLTERRFMRNPARARTGAPDRGPPTAFLIQRLFLRVGDPVKRFPALSQPNQGRRWPVELLNVLTRTTPDLVDPMADLTASDGVAPGGRLLLANTSYASGLVFWPRTARRPGSEVRFQLQLDHAGGAVDLPLLFVDNAAANDPELLEQVVNYYNGLSPFNPEIPKSGGIELRTMAHSGLKRRYAPEKVTYETSHETTQWLIAAEGRESKPAPDKADANGNWRPLENRSFDFGPLLQGVDQPPFYPLIETAYVRLKQLERLAGRPVDPVSTRYDNRYTAVGFETAATEGGKPVPGDVYLAFDNFVALDLGRQTDRTGGVGRPETKLIALSRANGPLGSNKIVERSSNQSAVSEFTGNIQPAKFFSDGAKLLGIISFADLLKDAVSVAEGAPKLRETVQFASSFLNQVGNDETAVRVAIRDRVLVPIDQALSGFVTEFSAANRGIAAADIEGALKALYPDVGGTFVELRSDLRLAIAAVGSLGNNDDGMLSFYARLTDLYESGRRFVAALERAAADPAAPMREELRRLFTEAVATLSSIGKDVQEKIKVALNNPPAMVQGHLRAFLLTYTLRGWRRLVFALPTSSKDTATDVRAVVDKAIDDAFLAALKDLPQSVEIERLPDDLTQLSLTFKKELDGKLTEFAQTDVNARDELQRVIDDWQSKAQGALKGLLYQEVARQFGSLIDKAITLEAALAGGFDGIGKSFVVAVGSLLTELVNFARAAAAARAYPDDLCGTAASALGQLIAAVVPEAMPQGSCVISSAPTCTTGAPPAVDDTNPILPAEICRELVRMSVVLQCLHGQVTAVRSSVPQNVQQQLDSILNNIASFQNELKSQGDLISKAIQGLDSSLAALHVGAADFAALCRSNPTAIAELQLNSFAEIARARSKLVSALAMQAAAFNRRISDLDTWAQILLVQAALTIAPPQSLIDAVRDAAAGLAGVSWAVLRLASELTVLATRFDGITNKKRKDALDAVVAMRQRVESKVGDIEENTRQIVTGQILKLRQGLDEITIELNSIQPRVAAARGALISLRDTANATATAVGYKINLVKAQLVELGTLTSEIQTRLVGQLEDNAAVGESKLLSWALNGLAASDEFAAAIFLQIAPLLNAPFIALDAIYGNIVALRDDIYRRVSGGTPPTPQIHGNLDQFAAALKGNGRAAIAGILVVGKDRTIDDDLLAQERKEVAALAQTHLGGPADLVKVLTGITDLFDSWRSNRSGIQQLGAQLSNAGEVILQGDLARLVDLDALRSRIEAQLRELIPSKLSLSYDLNGHLSTVAPVFEPEGQQRLIIHAHAQINLLPAVDSSKPGQPLFSVDALVDPFTIHLMGKSLDIVSLKFRGARFSTGSNRGSDFKVDFADVQLGEEVKFLKQLESYLRPRDGSGPYVVPMASRPGIEAGYSLNLGTITMGNVSFINVSLNAGCELPFDRSDALFKTGVGRRDAPFLISAAPYGGGGFFNLYANGKGIVGFEASFEFGGVAAFSFGLLEGIGRISLGIYCRQGVGGNCIGGFFFAGGAARIACFGISASFSVSMLQQNGSMQGSAVFSFSFSIGFIKLSFQVVVWHSEAPGFSASSAWLDSRTRYAGPLSDPLRLPTGNWLESKPEDQGRWDEYQRYFDDGFKGMPT